MKKSPFKYNWKLSDGYPAPTIKKHDHKVFGTFICGGGSTMGYKLSGFNHLGGVEIDDQISQVYEANHHPKYLFKQDLRKFITRTDLPEELFQLDILDGSPPCSSFSMSGNREKDWGKEKVFKEGQSLQRLDDLFFEYIALAKLLQPKIVIAENVIGLIQGNARVYVHEICNAFKEIGYQVQIFKLNAASMGVPQTRQRIFFICHRNDLSFPKLQLQFSEEPVFLYQIEKQIDSMIGKPLSPTYKDLWEKCKAGKSLSTAHPTGSFFNSKKIWKNQVCTTITATEAGRIIHYKEPADLHPDAIKLCGSFPQDYNFLNVDPKYLIGMSVPPVMMAQVSNQIYQQWLKIPQ